MKSLKCSLVSLAILALPTAVAAELKAEDAAEFAKIFAADAKIETLAKGLKFTEGPCWVGGAEGHLIFSDIPANRLMKWSPKGGLSVFREPSQKINGNTLDRKGRLVSCEHFGRKVSRTNADGSIEPLATKFDDAKFNSPNDVVVKSDGTIWFTDPDYGLEGREKEADGNWVYRLDPATGNVTALVKDFVKPNGLCFSPDEKKLYIADSGSPRHIRVFDVNDDGTLANGKLFVKLDKGGPDGIRCDADGRVWSSSGEGAQVFTSSGKLIARVILPKAGANLCFGGADGKTLFITARDSLHSVKTKVTAPK